MGDLAYWCRILSINSTKSCEMYSLVSLRDYIAAVGSSEIHETLRRSKSIVVLERLTFESRHVQEKLNSNTTKNMGEFQYMIILPF